MVWIVVFWAFNCSNFSSCSFLYNLLLYTILLIYCCISLFLFASTNLIDAFLFYKDFFVFLYFKKNFLTFCFFVHIMVTLGLPIWFWLHSVLSSNCCRNAFLSLLWSKECTLMSPMLEGNKSLWLLWTKRSPYASYERRICLSNWSMVHMCGFFILYTIFSFFYFVLVAGLVSIGYLALLFFVHIMSDLN